MEYELHWGEGPLGLTLCPDLGEDMPPVVGHVVRKDTVAHKANVSQGHLLVSVNGIDTTGKGYDTIVKMLGTMPRPILLRFRIPRGHQSSARLQVEGLCPSSSHASRHASQKVEQYTFVWMEGPLGMILRPSEEDTQLPYIYKINGKGIGIGMEKANVGDQLIAINGKETRILGYRRAISILKTISRPVVLKFYRAQRFVSITRATLCKKSGVDVYKIVWRDGELGLKLRAPKDSDVPVISRFTGRGSVKGLESASVGDELWEINSCSIKGMGYQDIVHMLRRSQKPVVLQFRKCDSSLMRKSASKASAYDNRMLTSRMKAANSISALIQSSKTLDLDDPEMYPVIENCAITKAPDTVVLNKALDRAAREAKVLEEALNTVKKQARQYEKILQTQERDKILAPALRSRSKDIVGKQNTVIAELTEAVSELKRDSYSGTEILSNQSPESAVERQSILEGLQNLTHVSVEVPVSTTCAECGTTDKESYLDMDDDGQYYCSDCWEKYMSATKNVDTEDDSHEYTADTKVLGALDHSAISQCILPASIVAQTSESQKDLQPEDSEDTAFASSVSSNESKNYKHVLAELAQALQEEEERALSEGNTALAVKLRAQRVRAISPYSLRSLKTKADSEWKQQQRDWNLSEPDPAHERHHDNCKDIRNMAERNIELARQVGEAHELVELARMSVMLSKDKNLEDDLCVGLSDEQIQLFKKLTTEADERMSMVDRLHPPDDSDSDSDSDDGFVEESDNGVWI